MQHIEFVYDVDPKSQGFFWQDSEQKRRDYFAIKMLRPAEAESVYQCRPGARVGSIFVEADFRYYRAPNGIDLGIRNAAVRAFIESSGGIVAQGWDTAITATSQSDFSACVTVLLVPCYAYHRDEDVSLIGPCDTHYDVYVLEVFKAKLEIGDLVSAIREQHQKWAPQTIVIEKKASGVPAMQALVNSNLPLEGVTPTESKRDRAVNGGGGAGSVQGWFRSGRVLFPQMGSAIDSAVFLPWLSDFTRELKDFTGEKGGRDDQVDAMVHVIGWAIREGGTFVAFPSDWQTPAAVDQQMMAVETRNPVLMAAGQTAPDLDGEAFDVGRLLEQGVLLNPFAGTCGLCRHFDKQGSPCPVLRLKVSALHPACEQYDDGYSTFSFPGR